MKKIRKLTPETWTILVLLAVLLAAITFVFLKSRSKPAAQTSSIYAYETSGNWQKYSSTQILGDSSTGSLFDPYCMIDKKYDKKYRCYVSKRNEASIVLYTSSDGINFDDDYITILKSDKPDEYIYNRATILFRNGTYYMYYTKQVNNTKSYIYRATSTDGISFKFDKNPILTPTLDFEKESVMNPDVIYNEKTNQYMMYYAAGEIYEPDVIGLATSSDGKTWTKNKEPVLAKNPDKKAADSFKVGATDVFIKDGIFYVFYIGYTDIDTGRIFMIKSNDDINFDRQSYEIVVAPDANGFDKESVYKPSVVHDEDNNRWLLYYNGRTEDREYIGLYIRNGDL